MNQLQLSGSSVDRRATAPAPAVIMNAVEGGQDSDTSTARTVKMMADYIRKCSADPAVIAAAEYARKRFAMGGDTPEALCWGVFWYVKHCVKFRQDEATMFRMGLRDEVDLLTAPDVLVRMKKPAEDCDGFTMLAAAMLTALGVPVAIATVAASPDEPWRWSHVFLLAMLANGPVPLDASHGIGPGWMIPDAHIFRFQAWNLDGRPIEVKRPRRTGLHGYVRTGLGYGLGEYRPRMRQMRTGLGDTCYDINGDQTDCGSPAQVSQIPTETTFPVVVTPAPVNVSQIPTETTFPVVTTAPTSPGQPVDIASIASSVGTSLSKIFAPPTTTTYNPATGMYTTTSASGVVTTSAANPAASSLTSSPLLIVGGLALAVLFASLGKKK